jgi:hypothetical protein
LSTVDDKSTSHLLRHDEFIREGRRISIGNRVRFLEDYLSGQLKLTGRTKVADGKARCGDDAERGGSCRRAGARVAEAGMIEEVEGIGAPSLRLARPKGMSRTFRA